MFLEVIFLFTLTVVLSPQQMPTLFANCLVSRANSPHTDGGACRELTASHFCGDTSQTHNKLTHAHSSTNTHTRAHMNTHTRYPQMNKHVYVCIHTSTQAYTHEQMHKYTHEYKCIYMHKYAQMYTPALMHLHICTNIPLHIHKCTHSCA